MKTLWNNLTQFFARKTLLNLLVAFDNWTSAHPYAWLGTLIGLFIVTAASFSATWLFAISLLLTTFVWGVPAVFAAFRDVDGNFPEWVERNVTWKKFFTLTLVLEVFLFFLACLQEMVGKSLFYAFLMLGTGLFLWFETKREKSK